MRGEYIHRMRKWVSIEGSPPHARGIHSKTYWDIHPVRITPACAGNTLPTLQSENLIISHHLISSLIDFDSWEQKNLEEWGRWDQIVELWLIKAEGDVLKLKK